MGNLIPSVLWLGFVTAGVYVAFRTRDPLGLGLILVLTGTILAWLSVNWLGLWQNRRMEAEMRAKLAARGEDLSGECYWVGFATPRFAGLLDAHQDVGFLIILPDRLKFVSEDRKIQVRREEASRVRFRPNEHTIIGMGRWTCVEGESEGRPIRLQIEPRTHNSMWANLRESRRLADRLRQWLSAPVSPVKPTAKPI